jgi:hypothetical protein
MGFPPEAGLSLALAVLCGSASAQHAITLNLQGMAPHIGQLFKVRMVEMPSGKQVAETTFAALEEPSLTLTFAGESGKSYSLDYFSDANGDGAYTAPPADHAWRKTAGPLHHQGLVINATHDHVFTDIQYPDRVSGVRKAGARAGNGPSSGRSGLHVFLRDGRSGSNGTMIDLVGRNAGSCTGILVTRPAQRDKP